MTLQALIATSTVLLAGSIACGQAASHVSTTTIGDTYSYTLFNDEPASSSAFLSLFTIQCNAPFVVTGSPTGWTAETDGFSYVTWANEDPEFPFPNEIAPGTSRAGFAILRLAGSPANHEYQAFTWDHATNTQGPDAAGTLSTPDLGEFTRCPADLDFDGDPATGWTPDGAVTISDLLSFLVGFEAGDLAVDLDDDALEPVNPDGAVTIEDLIFFLARFENGC